VGVRRRGPELADENDGTYILISDDLRDAVPEDELVKLVFWHHPHAAPCARSGLHEHHTEVVPVGLERSSSQLHEALRLLEGIVRDKPSKT
jgi:hypothetical protein